MVSVAEVVVAAALAGKVVVVVAVVATAVAVAVAVVAAVVEAAVVVSVAAVIVLVGIVVKLNQSVDFAIGSERMSGDMQGRRFCKMWAFLRSKQGDVLWNFKAHYLRLFI